MDPSQSTMRHMAYASWRAGAFDCAAAGCMRVEVDSLVLRPLLSRRLGDVFESCELSDQVRCFLQPEYSMIDCKNTLLGKPVS